VINPLWPPTSRPVKTRDLEEYFWEPVAGCWSLRRGADGRYMLEGQRPEPAPPPFTTIAWRLAHVGALCLANRANAFFGDGSVSDDATMADPRYVPANLPGSAAEGIVFLEGESGPVSPLRYHETMAWVWRSCIPQTIRDGN